MSERAWAVEGLDHLFVCPREWTRSIGFWRDTLGLPVLHDWSGGGYHGAALGLGGPRITLADPEPERDREVGFPVAQGRPYLYLRVRGLEAMLADLRAKGVKVLSGPVKLHWGPTMISVEDPDGIPLMLVEWGKP